MMPVFLGFMLLFYYFVNNPLQSSIDSEHKVAIICGGTTTQTQRIRHQIQIVREIHHMIQE
jgi:hypothetical protein